MPRGKKNQGGSKQDHQKAGRLGGQAKSRKNKNEGSSGNNQSSGGDITSSGSSYMNNNGSEDMDW